MSTTSQHRLPYAAALDGLRALAVIAVIGYHLDITWMRGGFLGVDLFFVISGFLITRILIGEHSDTGRIALGGFWVRRFRRLVPPLVAVVAVSVAATRLWGLPAQWQAMRGDAIASLAYVANWRFVLNETSYFDTLLGPSPLRHIWSLAVEEQWYVIWPLAMMLIAPWAARGRRRSWMPLILFGLAVVSAVWMAVLYDPSDASRVYYGTDTRAQQLIVGAVLAWLTVTMPVHFSAARLNAYRGAATAAVAGFGVAVLVVHDDASWLYNGGFLALSIGACVLVVAASVPGRDGPLGWLASPSLVAIGRRSYGLYLWHWPVIVFVGPPMGLDLARWPLAVLQIAVTVALNEVMFRLIETPVRRSARNPLTTITGWTVGAALTSVAAMAFLTTDVGNLPDIDVLRPDLESLAEPTTPTTPPAVPATTITDLGATTEHDEPADPSEVMTDEPLAVAAVVDDAVSGTAEASGPAIDSGPPKLMLVGDSTALVLGVDKPDEYPTRWRSIEYALLGCAITDGDTIDEGQDKPTVRDLREVCLQWADDWREISALYRPDVTLVMVGAWEVLDHVVDGERLSFPSAEWDAHVESALRRGIDAAQTGGGDVALMRLPCMRYVDNAYVSADARNNTERVAQFNAILERVAAESPTVSTLPLDDLLCPGGVLLEEVDGEQVRFDGVHLSKAGVRLVWEWLEGQLVAFESNVT